MSDPLVSVVMSVYNAGGLLPTAMRSILAQQGVDFELVVVDDGSTDGSGEGLDRYASDDPRVRVLHQANAGLTKALIRGCREARGEFIARQDVDDVSLPGRLERQAGLLRSDPSLAMVSSWVATIGPEGEPLYETRRTTDPDEATCDLLEHGKGAVHGSVMFRRSLYEQVGGYREEFYFAQDSDLWLRLGEVGRLAFVPAFLYMLRISEKSLSSRYARAQARLGELSHECQRARREGRSESSHLAEARNLRPGLIPAATVDPHGSDGLWFLARCLLSRGDRRGLKYARRYLRLRPFEPKAWASAAWGTLTAWRQGVSRAPSA